MGRFDLASSRLSLSELVSKTRKALWCSLVIALAIHISMSQIRISSGRSDAVKPLTTKFIKREPRLAKPLELRKRPKPRMRPMKRKVVTIKAKISRKDISYTPQSLQVLDSHVRPKSGIRREVWFSDVRFQSDPGTSNLDISREPEEKVDMSLEMPGIESLDTGRYHAMVIQDPVDKKKIKGFDHAPGHGQPQIVCQQVPEACS